MTGAGAALYAQTNPSPMISQPAQVPLSSMSNQPGSVTATQATANAGGGNTVNLLNSSANIEGAYSGSTPEGKASPGVLALTLDDALARGLRNNLGRIVESETALQARGAERVARSTLLPNLSTVVNETVEQLNLRTLGVEIPGFPAVIGPFNFFNAQAGHLNQSVLDFVRLRNWRTAKDNVESARQSARNARDLIVLAVGGAYLQLIATAARMSAAEAQLQTSRAVYQQATDRLNVGLAARIDATRTQVEMQTDQQRLRSLQADLDGQKLRLSRVIGLPLGQQFRVAEDFPYMPLTGWTVDQAIDRANRTRADLKAAEAGVRAAESAVRAARAERLPSLDLEADYGASGLRPTADAHGVFTVSGTLTVPLYQGGRVRGDVEQAEAALRSRQAELANARGQVDQDVRQAFIDLNAAADQVDVARSNVGLAQDTLQQARDRFAAGVADTVEVVQAQQTVVQADDDYIGAVFEHNLAKISLARAMGAAEQDIHTFLGKP
jgi:outer membrane protein TolC